jgi:hypothetical protein
MTTCILAWVHNDHALFPVLYVSNTFQNTLYFLVSSWSVLATPIHSYPLPRNRDWSPRGWPPPLPTMRTRVSKSMAILPSGPSLDPKGHMHRNVVNAPGLHWLSVAAEPTGYPTKYAAYVCVGRIFQLDLKMV